jgi:hypothetical protein
MCSQSSMTPQRLSGFASALSSRKSASTRLPTAGTSSLMSTASPLVIHHLQNAHKLSAWRLDVPMHNIIY